MIVAILVLVLTAAICVVGAVAVMLAFHTLRIRAAYAIPARPLLVPTTSEQIPADMAAFLAQVVPALHELGFVTVASVHAPQMLATIAWTQVLFLRYDRGDRASVMLLRPARTTTTVADIAATPPALIFATELANGRSVKTATQQLGSDAPPPPPTPLPSDRVAELYARHRADVANQLGEAVVGIMPEPGQEILWLQARAGAIATSMAERCGYPAAADAASYRPPWPLAIRGAWKALWTPSRRVRTYGFDVAPTSSSTPTDSESR